MALRLLLVVIVFASTAPAAQQSAPAFEVASVRPTASVSFSQVNVEFQPSRFIATMVPLRGLIAVAYGSEKRELEISKRIIGGPSWVDSAPFDIQAISREPVSQATMRLMLQGLLEERFGLRLRRDHRDLPAYALLLNRSDRRVGPELRPAQVRDCSTLTFERQRDSRCGDGAYVDKLTMTAYLYGSDKDMPALAEHLGGAAGANLDRPVVDRTGLAGRFDYAVRYAGTRSLSVPAGAEPRAPDLFTALREQLGLKLEPVTAPIEVLVIESVQQPTEN